MTTRVAPAGDPPATAHPPSREAAPETRRRLRLHWTSAVVLVVGVAITLTLTIGSVVNIHDAENRLLRSQLRQVAAAVQAVVPALQQPLVVADHIAGDVGFGAFKAFAGADVGQGAPFRSVSLWRRTPRGPVLVERVGATPELLGNPTRAARFLGGVRPGPILTVTPLLGPRIKGLGLAERSPTAPNLIVYAETTLPTTQKLDFPTGSPFAGLTFALYFGAVAKAPALMERSISLPAPPPTATAVVPFGSAEVTIVATLLGRPGVLPPAVPWGIGFGGLALTATATAVTERLMRRREHAEAVASERTRQYAEQRGIAETLQHSYMPGGEVDLPGIEVTGRYVSGTDGLEVGGDWYDVIRIDDAHLVVAVGDVSGRGLRAATVMGSLRHAIRAYAIQGDDPPTVIRKLDGLVDVGRDGCFATVLVVAADVPSRRIHVASAGHPPALLVGTDPPTFIDTAPNTPVGVESPGAVSSTSLGVAPGSALVVYTDGLVERRDRPIDAGLEALRGAVVGAAGTLDEIVGSILSALVPDGSTDDLAVLGVRFEPDRSSGRADGATPGWQVFDPASVTSSIELEHAPTSAGAARAFVLDALPWLDEDGRDVAALLVSEVATNAMLHADSDFEVTVVAAAPARRVRIGVRDAGTGRPSPRRPVLLSPRGRGLRIVSELATAWGVEWSDDGAAKTVWFELAPGTRTWEVSRPHAGTASGFTPMPSGHDRRGQ